MRSQGKLWLVMLVALTVLIGVGTVKPVAAYNVVTEVSMEADCEMVSAVVHNLSNFFGFEEVELVVDGNVMLHTTLRLDPGQSFVFSGYWADYGIGLDDGQAHNVILRTDDDSVEVVIGPCGGGGDVDIEPGDFRTQTQGGWGTRARGNNPGVYRDAHFAGCFPNGLTIGSAAGYSALFTTSAAVERFLPAGGQAGSFVMNYQDPTNTSAGVLAGQATALTLSVNFDLCDPNFGASDTNLAALIVVDENSACYGMSVQQVLGETNTVLAGLPSSFSASQINDCASKINENFVDGQQNNGFLGLP